MAFSVAVVIVLDNFNDVVAVVIAFSAAVIIVVDNNNDYGVVVAAAIAVVVAAAADVAVFVGKVSMLVNQQTEKVSIILRT